MSEFYISITLLVNILLLVVIKMVDFFNLF